MDGQLVQGKSVTLYPIDWATATQVAKDYGLASVSAGIRFIIRDWMKMRGYPTAIKDNGDEHN